MHADGAGTKASLAYMYWKRTGDVSVWKGVAQDAIVMNTDDLLCVGAVDNIMLSSTIGRNKRVIPGEVVTALIDGTEQVLKDLRQLGVNIVSTGGETADVGDLVRTVIVDSTVTARMQRTEVIDNAQIRAGDVVVGFASSGKANYEAEYNSGIGSNGLTAARHDVLSKGLMEEFPESFDGGMPRELVYSGGLGLEDIVEADGHKIPAAKLLLSPTRTYAPVVKRMRDNGLFGHIRGMVHCSGGGQSKVLHFVDGVHVVKDRLFPIPPIFRIIQKNSGTSWEEMYKVFNMGHRYEVYTDKDTAARVIEIAKSFGVGAQIIGEVRPGSPGSSQVTLKTEHGEFVYKNSKDANGSIPRAPAGPVAAKVPEAVALPPTRCRLSEGKRYNILAAPSFEDAAKKLQALAPTRFTFFPTQWGRFSDSGHDDIELGGFAPINHIQDSHVLFMADFHSNDAILSQFHALTSLCESLIASLTIALPYYPHGTKERKMSEGEVATANTIGWMLSSLPSVGKPTRVMVYDLHTLQNRFYFHTHAVASLHSTVPLLLRALSSEDTDEEAGPITAIAFPDDGAAKRFGSAFASKGFPVVICGKVREGDKRLVRITEGSCTGAHVLIVDDLTRSGGTLYECGKVLLETGAKGVSCFVAHAGFPSSVPQRFCRHAGKAGDFAIFRRFYTTNSNPTVTDRLPRGDVFRVLDILPQLLEDLG
uniref:phosphoribosylformylglycinamidine cyclo-ligase n=1 Tax=Zooxanthella nutricula TaxID=1333877 RepID=A0A7S2VLX6_9DINO